MTTLERVHLQGVPSVGFGARGDRCPEDFTFPSCLRAVLDYLGESLGSRQITAHGREYRLDYTYTTFVVTSGHAFGPVWQPGWHPDNVALHLLTSQPGEAYRRSLGTAGFQYERVDGQSPEAREKIRESLRQHRPVIAFGFAGPPEASILTGFEGDGLIGWSFFGHDPRWNQGAQPLPSGEVFLAEWPSQMLGAIVFKDPCPRPSAEQVLVEDIEYGLRILRSGVVDGRPVGQAALRAWADHLSHDDFGGLSSEEARLRFTVHDDAVLVLAEGRWYASQYFEMWSGMEPEATEGLHAAAEFFRQEHDLMWECWDLVGGIGRDPDRVEAFLRPDVRAELRQKVLAALRLDEEAAICLETLIGKIR